MLATAVTVLPIAAGGQFGLSLAIGLLSFCFPATFLLTNRDLDRVVDD
jgi:hypothetical protein